MARHVPTRVADRLKTALRGRPSPMWGNMRRTTPFSRDWGFERGVPIDRVYIDEFLTRHAADIAGHVLEVKDSTYTMRFGGERVIRAHVVDIDAHNPRATVVCDLAAPAALRGFEFDCIILTQTLHLVPDASRAVANCYAALKPGGTLLITVPVITKACDPSQDLWRFTPSGLLHVLREACPDAAIEVGGFGNVLASISSLMGLAAHELDVGELDVDDAEFHIIAWGRVDKPLHARGQTLHRQ